jgi:hypothetical protein
VYEPAQDAGFQLFACRMSGRSRRNGRINRQDLQVTKRSLRHSFASGTKCVPAASAAFRNGLAVSRHRDVSGRPAPATATRRTTARRRPPQCDEQQHARPGG